MIDESLKKRFYQKFDKGNASDCWEWKASIAGIGYGQIKLTGQRRQAYAHRVAYILENGDIPENMIVCHRCDNPKCVNPDHLFLGTQKDNMLDMKQKNRQTNGEKNARAKLTDQDVREIRSLLETGISQRKIASIYGVHQIQVSRIKTGKRWSHVK